MSGRRARGGWARRDVLVGIGALAVGAAGAFWLQENPISNAVRSYPKEASLDVGVLRSQAVGSSLLSAARSVIEGNLAPSLEGPGRNVYVCAHRPPGSPVCAMGNGEALGGSVAAAATRVRERLAGVEFGRVTVDVEVAAQSVRTDALGYRKRDPGLWGYRVGDAFVVPSDVLASDIYGGGEDDKAFRPDDLLNVLRTRFGAAVGPAEAATRFRTVAWVEGAHGQAVATYRLHGYDPAPVDVDSLERSGVWAADHLASTIRPDGKIRYLFDVSKGRAGNGYNLLRHGGSTYSLLQAYERTGHEPWLLASEAAIGYLLHHSVRDVRNGPFGGGETLWVKETGHVKLGGAGLALVMLTQHQQATGSDEHLEDARAYARFLVSQQQESGEFIYFASLTPGGEPRDRISAYYPGEAILGLMQLYALDHDPMWLETAKRGADWLIQVRDAGKGPSKLDNDHWLMIALSHLVRHTDEPRYIAHSHALADAVAYQARRNVSKVKTHLDYAGGYYDPPRSTPAATRGEGLVAVLDTCSLQGEPCDDVRALLLATVQHAQWAQYTPDLLWWTPTPGEVVGGFSGGIMDPDLRNDFTQHNMSALLGTERHLRATEGTVLPGGPRWTMAAQQAAPKMPAERVDGLLAPVRSLRGLHHWDRLSLATEGTVDPDPATPPAGSTP